AQDCDHLLVGGDLARQGLHLLLLAPEVVVRQKRLGTGGRRLAAEALSHGLAVLQINQAPGQPPRGLNLDLAGAELYAVALDPDLEAFGPVAFAGYPPAFRADVDQRDANLEQLRVVEQ